MRDVETEHPLVFTYRNHERRVASRRVRAQGVRLLYDAFPPWHPLPGFLVEAFDLDRKAPRHFALTHVLDGGPALLAAAGVPELLDGPVAAYVAALEAENRRLRDVVGWTNQQCPGRCGALSGEALAASNARLDVTPSVTISVVLSKAPKAPEDPR